MPKRVKCRVCELETFVDRMLTSARVYEQRYFEKIVALKRERLSSLTSGAYIHACCPEHLEIGNKLRHEYRQSLASTRRDKQLALKRAKEQFLDAQLRRAEMSILKGDGSYDVRRMDYEISRLKILVAQRQRRLNEVEAR